MIEAFNPLVETPAAPGVVPVPRNIPWRLSLITPLGPIVVGRALAVAGHRLAVEQSTGLFHSSRSSPESWGRSASSVPVSRSGSIPGRRRSGRSGSAAARCRGKRFSWAAGRSGA
jgi:hypothetical protein